MQKQEPRDHDNGKLVFQARLFSLAKHSTQPVGIRRVADDGRGLAANGLKLDPSEDGLAGAICLPSPAVRVIKPSSLEKHLEPKVG